MQQFRLSHDGWSLTQDSAANTTNAAIKTAAAGQRHGLTNVSVVVSGAASAAVANVLIKDGTSTIWKGVIPSGAAIGSTVNMPFNYPLLSSTNSALSINVDAAGAGCISTINATGFTTAE